MNLLRKILLSMLLGLAAIAPLSHTPTASAHPVPGQARYYAVYWRVDLDSPWKFYSSFYREADAQKYADWIRNSYRYEAFVYTVR